MTIKMKFTSYIYPLQPGDEIEPDSQTELGQWAPLPVVGSAVFLFESTYFDTNRVVRGWGKTPGHTNQEPHPYLWGWLGTTNNTSRSAQGMGRIVALNLIKTGNPWTDDPATYEIEIEPVPANSDEENLALRELGWYVSKYNNGELMRVDGGE